ALGFVLIRNPTLLSWSGMPSWLALGQGRWQRMRNARQKDGPDVDRILSKVKEHGLHSLSRREKKTLQRATDRQRRAG
ncbi:MAG: hypothetical protein QGH33_06600, partial [Pirellulaceae bacterium]|nr:hypothetical protein [Pirellulaceae bacterium]